MRGASVKNIVVSLFAAGLLAAPAFAHEDLKSHVETSRAAAKELQTTLVGELQAAMKAGGPMKAIQVCNTKAPAIAAEISKKHGFKIGRTSLKIRNPNNAPDAWEKKVLADFEKRKANGEDPTKLEHYEMVKQDGKSSFRYMKALPIPEGAPCPVCHGAKIDPALAAKLKELYPKDQATGFKVGDLRGAITIVEPEPM